MRKQNDQNEVYSAVLSGICMLGLFLGIMWGYSQWADPYNFFLITRIPWQCVMGLAIISAVCGVWADKLDAPPRQTIQQIKKGRLFP